MVSSLRSASVLLASLILHWTSACTHFSTDLSEVKRIKKDLAFEDREKTDRILNLGKDILSLLKDGVETVKENNIRDIVKNLSVFAGLAPGIGAVAFSIINMVLILIPQDDPVLTEVKKGFAEVNRKLDSLSFQISNLATDVEWFNYASVYSRDEVTILNAWDKFNDLRQNSNLVQSAEDRLRLAEIFTSYYEFSGAESSVSNLYRYLTVDSTSLSANLNNLLKKKFKCDITKIGKYNLYFSSLLWKGMVLNEFYWRLIGFNTTTKEDKHVQMFKKVSEAQLAAIDYCLLNYEDYMKKDVVETVKGLSTDDKQAIALKVKEVLDQKYNWYSWVVVVYNKANKDNHIVLEATEIDAGDTIVLVRFVRDGDMKFQDHGKRMVQNCFRGKSCSNLEPDKCKYTHNPPYDVSGHESGSLTIIFNQYATVTHAFYVEDAVEVPAPFHQEDCSWSTFSSGKVSFHYSREQSVCNEDKCQNNGLCERVLESNQWFCRCKNGFYGEHCELQTSKTPEMKDQFTPFRTIKGMLKLLESKVDAMNKCQTS
ncbi:SE-cephalotoxin-like [Girardinichthys multiradiatus]|uniref:SE-cephalotoxin-like n=1 Tax=Girardinichthys multiradiatus TaxID=208333 RepID=UPI001FAE049A|nr:SE-cephalotoxin-like [Girardinichthys multiradiatus]XP_047214667.1 SE-cephalotoxin-like [Girardinichthys multiradiatus]